MPDQNNADRFVVISGCSGGGKSTLLADSADGVMPSSRNLAGALSRKSCRQGGSAVPWVDPVGFARRAVAMALADRARVRGPQWLGILRSRLDRRCRGASASDGRAGALASWSIPSLPAVCISRSALAGDLCDRHRKAARFERGSPRVLASIGRSIRRWGTKSQSCQRLEC